MYKHLKIMYLKAENSPKSGQFRFSLSCRVIIMTFVSLINCLIPLSWPFPFANPLYKSIAVWSLLLSFYKLDPGSFLFYKTLINFYILHKDSDWFFLWKWFPVLVLCLLRFWRDNLRLTIHIIICNIVKTNTQINKSTVE